MANVLVILAGISFRIVVSSGLRQLTLQGFLPMTGKNMAMGGVCLPAITMAIRHIHEKAGLLDDYNLTYTWMDTQVICLCFIFFLFRKSSA